MINTWNLGRLTIALGIVMLAGNLALNTSMAADKFTLEQSDGQVVQVTIEPPSGPT